MLVDLSIRAGLRMAAARIDEILGGPLADRQARLNGLVGMGVMHFPDFKETALPIGYGDCYVAQ